MRPCCLGLLVFIGNCPRSRPILVVDLLGQPGRDFGRGIRAVMGLAGLDQPRAPTWPANYAEARKLTLLSQQLPRERDQLHCFSPRCRPKVPCDCQCSWSWLDRVENPLRCRLHSRRQGGWQGQVDRSPILALPAWSLRPCRLHRREDALNQKNNCDWSSGVVEKYKHNVRSN
jgi:hypothetical protein